MSVRNRLEKALNRGLVMLAVGILLGLVVGALIGSKYYSENERVVRKKLASLTDISNQYENQQQKLVSLEMADQINRMAQEKLRQKVTELQTDRVKLESELYVYKKLLEDDDSEAGLNLDSLTIRPVQGDSNRYSYDIVLRRKAVQNQLVEATLSLDIEGQLHGIPFTLAFKDADPDLHDHAMSVSFKYFKVVKGEFVLPDHFEARSVVISLYETGRADSLVIKEMPWQPITL